jgi:hypothetical protein
MLLARSTNGGDSVPLLRLLVLLNSKAPVLLAGLLTAIGVAAMYVMCWSVAGAGWADARQLLFTAFPAGC